MPVSDETIVVRLRALLEEVDLQTTSERILRETIEAELNEDLSERKALIREEVQTYLLKQQEAEDEDAEEGDDAKENGESAGDAEDDDHDDDGDEEVEVEVKRKKPKRKRKSAFGSKLSADLQAFLGQESMPRTEVVKKMWEYIKEHNLQNPNDKRKIILDDKLKTIFKSPLTMFSMNKQLSRHVYVDDSIGNDEAEEEEEEEDDDKDDDEAPTPKKAPNKRKTGGAQKSGDAKEPKKRRASSNGSGGGSALSAPMQKFLGVERMARPQVVKQLWEYIRANNLQDPNDKRTILVDKKLGTLFTNPLTMFTLNKQLTPHILKGQ